MRFILLICMSVFALYFQVDALSPASQLFLRPCKATDPLLKECWLQKIEDLRLDLMRGIPEIRLRSIDPLHIRRLPFYRKSRLVSYEARYRNFVFSGLKNFQILDVNIDWNTLIFKLKILLPAVRAAASFSVNGTVMTYPLVGNGSVDVNYLNMMIDLVLDGQRYIRNGQEHIMWKEGSIEISYEYVHYQIRDLLKDRTQLLFLNNFLNQNAEALKGILTAVVVRTLGSFVVDAINLVHEAFPTNSLYPIY